MKRISKSLYEACNFMKEENEEQNLSITKVAEKFRVDRHSITKHLEDYISYCYFKEGYYYFLSEQELKPVKYFLENPTESLSSVAKKFKTKDETIKRRMLIIGEEYKPRIKRNFNRRAFSEIKTEDDAYWLGFILADGYINEDRGFLKIKLSKKDEEHLKKFASYMKDERKDIIKYETGGAYDNNNMCCSIEFDSREIVNNLVKYGIRQGKSGKEIPLKIIDENLKRSYIRGMIDGDGHVKNSYFKYVGSKESCLYMKEYFSQFYIFKEDCKYIYEKGKIFSFEINSKKVNSILKHIYNEAKIFLDRKYQTVQNF